MTLTILTRMSIIRSWIERTVDAHEKEARPVAEVIEACGFQRLPDYFGAAFLDRVQCVSAERVPLPPLASTGLKFFASIESARYTGITYGDTYFVDRKYERSESMHFHELIHAVQWDCLGFEKFLRAYGVAWCETAMPETPSKSWPTPTSSGLRPTPSLITPRLRSVQSCNRYARNRMN